MTIAERQALLARQLANLAATRKPGSVQRRDFETGPGANATSEHWQNYVVKDR